MISARKLAELRRLDAQATPGPWEAEARGWIDGTATIRCGPKDDNAFSHHAVQNAALIVAMRNALPELLETATRVGRDAPQAQTAPHTTPETQAPSSHTEGQDQPDETTQAKPTN